MTTLDTTSAAARQLACHLAACLSGDQAWELAHATLDPSLGGEVTAEANAEAQAFWNENAAVPITPRTGEQVLRFFEGLEMIEPGLVSMSRWRPEPNRWGDPPEVAGFCGVGRKP
jgi:S-adenosyl methyltransferase